MRVLICPDCERPGARLGDVVTSEELLAALTERAGSADFEFEADESAGECLVYMLRCDLCGEQSMHSLERLLLTEDPEPIG